MAGRRGRGCGRAAGERPMPIRARCFFASRGRHPGFDCDWSSDVCSSDLVLDASRVRGAALDVFAAEPLPAGHPFWRHARVLVSPHVAAVTARFWERETGLIVENIRRYLAGSPLTNTVDLEAGY